MSWWLDKDRESFSREVAERFSVNRADAPRRGTAQIARDLKEQSSRGGKSKAQQHGTTGHERPRTLKRSA